MYELVFTRDARDYRSPLHLSVTHAIEYVEATANSDEDFEVWQVADDTNRTRMVTVVTGRVIQGVAHYNRGA